MNTVLSEQIKEFEQITDYVKKLEWWKNQNLWPDFEAQSLPYQVSNPIHQRIYDWRIDKITVIPTNVEEVRVFVDTYPNQFTEIEIRDLVVQKIETTTSIIEEFTWELKCGEDSKKNPYFVTGLRYQRNQEKESRMLLNYLQDPKRIPSKVLLDFFSGLFVKRLHIATNEIEEIRNDNFLEYRDDSKMNNDIFGETDINGEMSLDVLKGQINGSGIRFFAVMYVIAKLNPTLDEIQCTDTENRIKGAAKEALEFVKKKYDLRHSVNEETLLKYQEPKKWEQLFCGQKFKKDHHPTIASYLKAVRPDKANEIESILVELNQSK